MTKRVNIRVETDEAEEKAAKKRRAEEAVQRYEELRARLESEEERWQEEHKEAWEDMQGIGHLRDDCRQAIDQAKPLVAECGETVGDFKVQQKTSKPHYDPEKFAKVLCELESENLGEVFKALYEAGVVTSVGLDKTAIGVFFPRNPEVQEGFADAFDPGGEPLTPAVTVPKL